jgi:hypothetical protein
MDVSPAFQKHLLNIVAWSNVAWKGLSELCDELPGHSASASASTRKRKRRPDNLDNLSDQKVVNIVAYLRHVHAPPQYRYLVGGGSASSLSAASSSHYGVAILSDGKHGEVALKLWNEFSNARSLERLRNNVGKMVECTAVAAKHCPFLDAMTLNTTSLSQVRVLTDEQAEIKTYQITPSAPDPDTQEDEGDQEKRREENQDNSDEPWMCVVKNDGKGERRERLRDRRKFLGLDHLLACPNYVGTAQFDCRLDGFVIDEVDNQNNVCSSSSTSSFSSASSSLKATHAIVTKVCIKCSMNMAVDRNNITYCPGNCPPLPHNNDFNCTNNLLPWKWSYRNGTMTLRDKKRDKSKRDQSMLRVRVASSMVQHLVMGIPPLALVRHAKESDAYYLSTKLKPWSVASKTMEAYRHPGACPVRVILKCTADLDQNGQLMHNGREFHLVSFNLL